MNSNGSPGAGPLPTGGPARLHRRSGRRARVLALLVLLLAAMPALGRTQVAASDSAVQDAGESAEPESVRPSPAFESPRATMETFFERYLAGDVLGAGEVLGYDDLRDADREELAESLKFVLDRAVYFKPYQLPGRVSSRAHSSGYLWALSVAGLRERGLDDELKVVFEPDSGGAWRVVVPDASDLDALRRLFVREALEPVPGIEQPQGLSIADLIEREVPEELRGPVLGIELWQWAGLGILLLLAVVLDLLSRGVTAFLLARAAGKDRSLLDRDEVAHFARPVGLLLGAVVFRLGLELLHLPAAPREVLRLSSAFVATLAAVWSAYRLVDVFCGALKKKADRTANRFDDVLVPLLRRTLKIFVVVIGLVYMASQWTDNLWRIVAGLGVGSLAVGFAAKDSIENLFGTFTVLMDKPFQLGDWITVGDIDGNVEEVGFRSTRVRTFYNSLITVPNSRFIGQSVDNMGARRYRRIKTTLSLTYDTPPETVEAFCEGVRTLILNHPFTRKDSYHVYLNGLGESSLDVLLYCFVETPDWSAELREKHRLLADILRLAERLGVSFAFPSRSLYMVERGDLEHADRPASDPAGRERGRAAAEALLADEHGARGTGAGLSPSEPQGLQQGDEGGQ